MGTEKTVDFTLFFLENSENPVFYCFVKSANQPEDPGGLLTVFLRLLIMGPEGVQYPGNDCFDYGLYRKKPGEPRITAKTRRGPGCTASMDTVARWSGTRGSGVRGRCVAEYPPVVWGPGHPPDGSHMPDLGKTGETPENHEIILMTLFDKRDPVKSPLFDTFFQFQIPIKSRVNVKIP